MEHYERGVRDALARLDMKLLYQYAFGPGPCGCHTREGEPLCVCEMYMLAVRRHIIPAGLKRGRIIPVRRTPAAG